mgnify:CR=1 FL=1
MTYKPKRVAPPSIIADAAGALHAITERSEQIGNDERDLWHNAIQKAHNQLMDGVRYEQLEGGVYLFPSRTRSGTSHRTNGSCDCEAYTDFTPPRPCWHRAAKRIIELIAEIEQATLVRPPQAPPQCGGCGAAMFQLGPRYVCPACHRSRAVPVTRPPVDYAKAQADMDELFPARS